MTADEKMREAYEMWLTEQPYFEANPFNAFQAGAAWQAAQQVQVSEVLQKVYDFLAKEYRQEDESIGEYVDEKACPIWKEVCTALAAINGGGK